MQASPITEHKDKIHMTLRTVAKMPVIINTQSIKNVI